jgi:hypothetical protein
MSLKKARATFKKRYPGKSLPGFLKQIIRKGRAENKRVMRRRDAYIKKHKRVHHFYAKVMEGKKVKWYPIADTHTFASNAGYISHAKKLARIMNRPIKIKI